MKNSVIILFVFAFFAIANTATAQVRLTKGDASVLKGQSSIAVKFTYDNMTVGKLSEKDYLTKKVEEYNKKEAGKGDNWKKAWISDRESRFEPKFLDLLAKATSKNNVIFSKDASDAKYTLLVNTDFTEPGFNIYVAKANAFIRTTIQVVETKNPSNVLAVISASGPGRTFTGHDWDTGLRLTESYAKTGKDLGAFFSKKAFK